MKLLNLKITFLILFAGQLLWAAPVIPKLTLATCEMSKSQVTKWFTTYYSDKKAFDSVVEPLKMELSAVNLGGQAGIADMYHLSIKGFDKDGKVATQRELNRLAVNYTEPDDWQASYSVSYTPYDTGRQNVEPFSLLIEGDRKEAVGTLAVVPLQATSQKPFESMRLDCTVAAKSEDPVQLSSRELLAMSEANQFEVLYNLPRLGFVGTRHNGKAKELTDAAEAKLKAELAAILDERELPPLRYKDATDVKIHKTRCGSVSLQNVMPIYDSVSYRSADWNNVIGYKISTVNCKNPARTFTRGTDSDGKPDVRNQKWQVRDITITTHGLIKGHELSGASFRMY